MTTASAEGAAPRPIDRRLRRAALLIAPGLAIQAATLGSAHPLAFIVFLCPGGLLVAAGIALFLWGTVAG